MSNRDPAVSPDGSTVTWSRCETDGTGCDVYVAQRRADGAWGTVVQLTDSTGEDILPDTDGRIVTYASNAAGDYDVWWEGVDGTDEHSLVLTDAPGSIETNPTISGGAISFEREAPGDLNADLYVVRPEQGDLYRLTATPSTDETLNALSVLPDGTLRAAWAQPDGITPGHNDIHALSGRLGSPAGPEYATCLRYDPAKAHRAGSTVPLRLQLCDAAGTNLSSPEIALTATGLVKLDGSAATAFAEDSGNANPDQVFRYDADLGGYVFNLSTRGLSRGTWALRFVVEGSPTVHELRFDVRSAAEAGLAGADHRLRAVGHLQLGEDRRDVVGHRLRAQRQRPRDRRVRPALRDQPEDLPLPVGQRGEHLAASRAAGRRRPAPGRRPPG